MEFLNEEMHFGMASNYRYKFTVHHETQPFGRSAPGGNRKII
jgi:hypothetical protein